ncbi:MAG: radical SAM protein [Chloroflexi bacterium]|uniref:FeMo cofactor biosynthesis protein NifB n=1 Tax=Candidatus Chlorohelix allophototropha TaxID=3003348 RepID=A0A8T7M9L5_9CHLR|nr:radical SAM protein [Chloroflexota bacterium]WJW68688.1 radical SAM protein [Chloroflexota bacterium L227-S17]
MTFTTALDSQLQPDLSAKVAAHPCYGKAAHFRFGRIHVPVAPKCNIQCGYCVRKYDCPNENRPGVTTKVVSPEQALTTIRQAMKADSRMTVLGIAGPGDPLANSASLETFLLAKEEFPGLVKCVSTNGLALPERVEELHKAGVTALTITINAVDPEVGQHIYTHVRYQGKTYRDREAFEILSANQLAGLKEAVRLGMVVKVNSVLIPGVNDQHMVEIARVVSALGAYVMNIMPLIPQAKFKDVIPPTPAELAAIRTECEKHIKQFMNCRQCRADAVGVPGEEDCSTDNSCTPKFLNDQAPMNLQPRKKV